MLADQIHENGPVLVLVGIGILALVAMRLARLGKESDYLPPEASLGKRFAASSLGVALICAVIVVWALLVPAQTMKPALWFFYFLAIAVIGVYHWQRPDLNYSSRDWAMELRNALILIGGIWLVGMAYALLNGHRGGPVELIESNGTFVVVAVFLPCPALVALGGFVRARLLERWAAAGQMPA